MLRSDKISKLRQTSTFREMLSAFLVTSGKLEPRGDSAIASFESEFAREFGDFSAVVFPHARVALHYILRAFSFEKESEILMTPLTIADMVNSIHLAGLRPRFVDIEPETLNFDLKALQNAITPRSKAILITYLGGIVPDLSAITEIARANNLKIIEDASQAFGASFLGKKVGTWGDVSIFSLTNFKVITSLFGGMTLTPHRDLAAALRSFYEKEMLAPQRGILRKHAAKNLLYSVLFQKRIFSYFTYFIVLALEYFAPELTYRLYTGNIKVILGDTANRLLDSFPGRYLCRYTALQARLGLASFRRAGQVVRARTRNGERLRKLLKGTRQLSVPSRLDPAVNAYWRFPIFCSRSDELKKYLLGRGIDSAKMFLCLCSQERGFERYHQKTPMAEQIKKTALVLEIDETISRSQIDFVASSILDFFKENPLRESIEAISA